MRSARLCGVSRRFFKFKGSSSGLTCRLFSSHAGSGAELKLSFRERMLAAPAITQESPAISNRKLGSSRRINRAPLPSQVKHLFSPGHVAIEPIINPTAQHISDIDRIFLGQGSRVGTPDNAAVPSPKSAEGSKRQSMVQMAASFSAASRKNTPKSSRDHSVGTNVTALLAIYKRTKEPNPALYPSI